MSSVFCAMCVCVCAFVHRRHWQSELGRLESEIKSLREKNRLGDKEDRVGLFSEEAETADAKVEVVEMAEPPAAESVAIDTEAIADAVKPEAEKPEAEAQQA